LFAVCLHTCTAVARSLCVSWAFLSQVRRQINQTFRRILHIWHVWKTKQKTPALLVPLSSIICKKTRLFPILNKSHLLWCLYQASAGLFCSFTLECFRQIIGFTYTEVTEACLLKVIYANFRKMHKTWVCVWQISLRNNCRKFRAKLLHCFEDIKVHVVGSFL